MTNLEAHIVQVLLRENEQLERDTALVEGGPLIWPRYAQLVAAECTAASPSTPCDSTSAASLAADCWTRLHSGPWQAVPLIWRRLYERVGLLEALRLRRLADSAGEVTADDAERHQQLTSALRALDLCLMMGADEPHFTSLVHSLVAEIEQTMQLRDPPSPSVAASSNATSKRPRDREESNGTGGSDAKLPKLSTAAASSSTVDSPLIAAPSSCSPSMPSSALARPVRRVHLPSLLRFGELVAAGEPVILTGALAHWPALEADGPREWTRAYLRRMAGRRTVPIEVGASYSRDDWTQRLMTLDEFLDRHMEEAATSPSAAASSSPIGYLAQHALFSQVPLLRRDISVPDYCCVAESDDEPALHAWLGPAGTVSPLHRDPTRNLLAQVRGTKSLRMYAAQHDEELYPHEPPLANTSRVDAENVDPQLFPRAASLPYWECELSRGELLYIPTGVWHHVRAVTESISVSFWWT